MHNFFRFRFSTIQRFLSKFPGFSKPEKHSLGFLNSAQFLGVINDNIYKLVLVFFLIELQGPENANYILSAVGSIFVIPFLLFSSLAGILADRFSKSRLVMLIKAAEIVIILLVIVAFIFKDKWAGYSLLFLLSTQSAMFGPSKYGIIPELVPKNQISKANGLITSFTYLAIIFGTFLASFMTEITNRNFVLIGCFCLLVAIVGFLSSFGIKYTPPQGTKKKIRLFFIREIIRTLIYCKDKKHLLVCIFSSAYFLFVGAFTQLNIIPFAIQALGLTEVAGGYLFLTTALGIAFGAYIAGKASKTQIELGLSCFAAILISIFFFLLAASTGNLVLTVISLLLLGFFGGNFVVPLDAFIQLFSPEEHRGQVIAASNFLSFVGVLFASFAIYFFNQALGFTSAKSFGLMGLFTIFFSIFLILRVSDLFLSYSAKKILSHFFSVKTADLNLVFKTSAPLLMLENATWLKAWLLCGVITNLNLLIPQYKVRRFPWFQNLFFSIHRIASPQKFEDLVDQGKLFMDGEAIPCIYLTQKIPPPEKNPFSVRDFFLRKKYEVIYVNFEQPPGTKYATIKFSK